jgi:cytoskeleton protein RodZ
VFEIGSSLRAAREHQKLELADVERATHIRAKYLKALEDEDWNVLPGTAYAKGFLRTYSDFLGLDGPRFVEEFNERFAQPEEFEPPTLVRVRRRRRRPGAPVLVALLLAVAVGLFSWRLATGGGGGGTAAHAPPPPPIRTTTATTTTAAAKPLPAPARVEVDAARGSCWLTVRVGSDTGRTLYERTLQVGERARFVARRLWIRYGAPWNVDATVNGKHVRLPTATANVVYP